MSVTINRRGFIGAFAAAATSAVASDAQPGAKAPEKPAAEESKPGKLIVSAPVLQNAAERSMGVAFAVSADAATAANPPMNPLLLIVMLIRLVLFWVVI